MAIKILLAHYEPRVRKELREKLEKWGFWVEEARDGAAVQRRLKALNPSLIMAYAPLPKVNTPDLIRNIRSIQEFENTPILVFSDIYKSRKLTDELRNFGSVEFIEWPIPDEELKKTLESIVSRYNLEQHKKPETRRLKPPVDFVDDEIEQKLAQTLSGVLKPDRLKKKRTPKAPSPEEKSHPDISSEEQKARPEEPRREEAPSGEEETETKVLTAEELFGDLLSEIEEPETSEKVDEIIEEAGSAEDVARTQAMKVDDLESEIGKIIESTLAGARKSLTEDEATKTEQVETGEPESEESSSKGQESEVPSEALTQQMEAIAIPTTPAQESQPVEVEEEQQSVSDESPQETISEDTRQETVEEEPTTVFPAVMKEGIPFGPYILLERIATGGMAELFKAKKKGVQGFEKIVAIKRILPHLADNEEFITMFIDEAKLVAGLTHPNIAQIYDLGEINGDYYIAMEYVDGKDLRTVLREASKQGRDIPIPVACMIASRICSALDYAHQARDQAGRPLHVVHRDVSPQNVLISYDGEVKLTDFGVAKAAIKAHQTMIGALKGKLLYMSPEQAWGKPVDGRSDIFSVGVILYEMLTGQPLFYRKGDNEVSILEKVRQAEIPDIQEVRPDLPEALVAILKRALAKNPEDRYQRAGDMRRDLEKFLAREGYLDTPLLVAQFICELFREEAGDRLPVIEAKLRDLTPAPIYVPEEETVDESSEETAIIESPPVQLEKQPQTKTEEEKPGEKRKQLEKTIYPQVTEEVLYPQLAKQTATRRNWYIFAGIVIVAIVLGAVFFMLRPGEEKPSIPAEKSIVAQQRSKPAPEKPVEQTPVQSASTQQTDIENSAQQPSVEKEVTSQQTRPGEILTEEKQSREMTPVKDSQSPAPESTPATESSESGPRTQRSQAVETSPPATRAEPKTSTVEKTPSKPVEASKSPPVPVEKPEPPPAESQPPQTEQQESEAPVPTSSQTSEEETKTGGETPVSTPGEPEKPEEENPAPVAEQEAPAVTPEKPAQPPVRTGDLVEIPEVPPRELVRKKPDYPLIARRNRWQDTVILRVLVDENGNPIRAVVLRSKYKVLADAAVEAAMASKFEPARHQGVRVKSWISLTYLFRP